MVLLVIMRKEVGNPVSGLSEKDGWLWEGGGENRVVGPREQSKCGEGGGPVKIWGKEGLVGDGEWNPFSWEGTPGGRGTSRIRVGEQDDPSSEYQRVRPVSWVLARPRRA